MKEDKKGMKICLRVILFILMTMLLVACAGDEKKLLKSLMLKPWPCLNRTRPIRPLKRPNWL
jgi:hypothetical protein